MKLTSHQKKIIDAIISKKVYDIPSYLEYFDKLHQRQYDFKKIRAVFEQCEDGRTYMFRQESDSFYYTDIYDSKGNVCNTWRVPNKSTYEFVEYPITSPVKANLTKTVNVEFCSYNGQQFSFDFLKNSYPVADSFEDIIDFITLWSYLKREALILEVDKQVEEKDLSIFFELREQEIKPNTNPRWCTHFEVISDATDDQPARGIMHHLPDKDAKYYLDRVWKLNEEIYLTCKDFIDKKIIASSELRVYQQKKFKTVEQISQSRNLFVAWVAVFISVISVLIGNIWPLLKPQAPNYLHIISAQIASINESVRSDTVDEELLRELQKVSQSLAELSQQQLTQEDMEVLERLESQLERLNAFLSENTTE